MKREELTNFIVLIKSELAKMSVPFSKEELSRLEKEIQFVTLRQSLYEDVLEFIKLKNTGRVGDRNEPNSILFYVLGVTSKKPDISRDFRFNYELDKDSSRVSPPDVDIDFEQRDGILNYLCDKYGDDHVALIGTSIAFKPKAAVQMAAKALDITKTQRDGDRRFSSENDQAAKTISKLMPNIPGMTLKKWLGKDEKFEPQNTRIEEAMKLVAAEEKKYPAVFKHAEALEGKIKAYGTHAAGVVVSRDPIVKDIPLHFTKILREDIASDSDIALLTEEVRIKNKQLPSTQFDMGEVEELGLLKFDFLQVETLRQIKTLIRTMIPSFHYDGKLNESNEHLLTKSGSGYSLNFDIENIETDDPNVFKLIDDLKLEGLFQVSGDVFKSRYFQERNWDTGELIFEEDGSPKMKYQKGLIEVIGCSTFDDIVVCNAIGRPGPLKSRVHYDYARGKKHPDKVEFPHPKLEAILKPTYGLLCYQEQLIGMAQALGGFTFAQADKLRKACAKKDMKLLPEIEVLFRDGCKKNKIPSDVTDSMWEICVKFGEYAFNLSHSTAYGYVTYQTAFLKTYFPTEFICAILSSAVSDEEKLGSLLKSFREEYEDLRVWPPDINISRNFYVPIGPLEIVAPFSAVKGLGSKVSDALVEKQPYSSIFDFVLKTNIGQGIIESLIDIGIFRSFGDKELIMSEYKRHQSIRKRVSKTSGSNVPELFTGSLF